MATATTGWKCNHIAEITSETATQVTIKVTCYWRNDGWRYDVNNITGYVYCNGVEKKVMDKGNVNNSEGSTTGTTPLGSYSFTINKTTAAQSISCYAKIDSDSSYAGNYTRSSTPTTVTVPAKTSYTISYDANGGVGAPSAQTKWHGTNLVISNVKPTRSGYTFKQWETTTSTGKVTYAPGETCTRNENLKLIAVWEGNGYTVTYNANGGTEAPAAQTKTHGVDLTLSSVIPIRTNYNFLGWGTSAGSSTVTYNPGDLYSTNADITLYAIWSQDYTKPRIRNLEAYRCDSSGNPNGQGTYARLRFNVATDKPITMLDFYFKSASATSWSSGPIIDDISNTGGDVDLILSGFTTNTSYSLYIYAADSGGYTISPTVTVGGLYIVDYLNGGNGIAFGKEAELNGYLDCNYKAKFRSSAEFSSVPTVNGVAVALVTDTNAGVADHTHSEYALVNHTHSAYALSGHTHSNYALTSHSHDNYLHKTGGEITGYLQVNNSYAAIGKMRFGGEWLGFYASAANANNDVSRKGYIGHDASTHFYVNNAAGGSNYVNKAWTVSSDERLKKDIENMPKVFIDIWKELSPKLFKWNELNPDEGKFQFGLIAQEVIGIFGKYGLDYTKYSIVSPYKLQGDDTEYFGVTYDNYQMMTALVVKNQQKEIDILKSEVSELKDLVKQLLGKEE